MQRQSTALDLFHAIGIKSSTRLGMHPLLHSLFFPNIVCWFFFILTVLFCFVLFFRSLKCLFQWSLWTRSLLSVLWTYNRSWHKAMCSGMLLKDKRYIRSNDAHTHTHAWSQTSHSTSSWTDVDAQAHNRMIVFFNAWHTHEFLSFFTEPSVQIGDFRCFGCGAGLWVACSVATLCGYEIARGC